MDYIDFFVCFVTCIYIANLVVQLATECAKKVWDRTKKNLDYLDFVEACHIPSTTNVEAMIIMVGATVRTILVFPLELYKSLFMTKAERAEARISQTHAVNFTDILGSVAVMLSGYPERANQLYDYEHQMKIFDHYEAIARDHQELQSQNRLEGTISISR